MPESAGIQEGEMEVSVGGKLPPEPTANTREVVKPVEGLVTNTLNHPAVVSWLEEMMAFN